MYSLYSIFLVQGRFLLQFWYEKFKLVISRKFWLYHIFPLWQFSNCRKKKKKRVCNAVRNKHFSNYFHFATYHIHNYLLRYFCNWNTQSKMITKHYFYELTCHYLNFVKNKSNKKDNERFFLQEVSLYPTTFY